MNILEDEYIGREVRTTMRAVRGKNGWWTVTHTITQLRSTDLENWEHKTITADVQAPTINQAQSESVTQMMLYLESINGDLFLDSELLDEDEEKVN